MSSLSRERIAAAAIRIADAEGIDAVSMRRIAAALGVGTMSLYHYVRTKHDLMSLVSDSIMSEFVIPDGEMPSGWRAGLAEIARRTRATFDRHPWVIEAMHRGDEGGPGESLMRHMEQTLSTMAGLDLEPAERLHVSGTVDEYVMGYIFRSAVEATESEAKNWVEDITRFIDGQLSTGDYPHFRALFGDREISPEGVRDFFESTHNADRFEQGLEIVLDGIELYLQRRRKRRV